MFVGGRRLGAALFAALMCVGAVGCSGGSDSPQSLPPISTTPAPSQTSAPSQSPKAAAVAVVREYFRARNALASDENADALAAITTRDCACRQLVRSARRLAAKNQHYFGQAKITQLLPTSATATEVQILVRYDSTPGGVRDADGTVISRDSAHHSVKQLFDVQFANGGWRVARIVLLKSGD